MPQTRNAAPAPDDAEARIRLAAAAHGEELTKAVLAALQPTEGPEAPLSEAERQQRDTMSYLRGEMGEARRAQFEEELTESEALREELARSREVLDSLMSTEDAKIVRLANAILAQGFQKSASDIHVVPQRRNIAVRFRIDGVLQDAMTLPQNQLQPIIDRIKVMADMNLAERRLPQDGRIPVKHEGRDYDVRVSILPTLYGERAVMRILSRSNVLLGLDKLNLGSGPLAALRRLAKRNSGLILTSGATGSGKTTLLYSLLLEIQSAGRPGRNILTVEDPVECALEGISQTAVNVRAGLRFSGALRAMLRQDPDVILCGEMRDLETAEIASETALTGHLVLSALHTTSALGAIQRLRDMGLENFLIADILAGVIGQRLVRRIDTRQVETYEPDPAELAAAGMTPSDGPFLRGVPTEENGGTGFQGRVPLLEVVEITPELRRLIAGKASYEDLWRAAFLKNAASLRDDARAKVKAGLTTVEEVNWALFDSPAF